MIEFDLDQRGAPMHLGGARAWLSLAAVPVGARLAMLHDTVGPALNLAFSPLADDPPKLDVTIDLLPGMAILHGRTSPLVMTCYDRNRLTDGFALTWSSIDGHAVMRQRGAEASSAYGAPVLIDDRTAFESRIHADIAPVLVRMDRALLAPLVPDIDDAVMRPIPPDRPAFGLLKGYLAALHQARFPATPELANTVAQHLCDLMALTIGTRRDATELARARGGRAARLAAIKHWARARLHRPDLSVAKAAAAQGVTPRYVQMLFAGEDCSFSGFVLRERLALARRRLGEPNQFARTISAIAFEAGFGDLSYFNRSFRAAYGEAPSDVRARAAISL